MDFDSFFNQYNGQPNVGDTDANKGQCVGLVEVYTDALNIPHTWGNATDLFNNADPTYFKKTVNNPNDLNQFPAKGDILVISGKFNPNPDGSDGDGHTGIVWTATGTNVTLFEANDPFGSAPHLQDYSEYPDVIGWLTPIAQLPDTTSPLPANYADIIKKATAYDSVCVFLGLPLDTDFENDTDPNAETVKKAINDLKVKAETPVVANLPVSEATVQPSSQAPQAPEVTQKQVEATVQPNPAPQNEVLPPVETPVQVITPSKTLPELLYHFFDFLKVKFTYQKGGI